MDFAFKQQVWMNVCYQADCFPYKSNDTTVHRMHPNTSKHIPTRPPLLTLLFPRMILIFQPKRIFVRLKHTATVTESPVSYARHKAVSPLHESQILEVSYRRIEPVIVCRLAATRIGGPILFAISTSYWLQEPLLAFHSDTHSLQGETCV